MCSSFTSSRSSSSSSGSSTGARFDLSTEWAKSGYTPLVCTCDLTVPVDRAVDMNLRESQWTSGKRASERVFVICPDGSSEKYSEKGEGDFVMMYVGAAASVAAERQAREIFYDCASIDYTQWNGALLLADRLSTRSQLVLCSCFCCCRNLME